MNIWKKTRIVARLAVFVAILLGALSSAIVAPTPAQADKGKEEPTLILLFGAEDSLQEAGKVISQRIEAVELLRSYPKEYLQEFPNAEKNEAGHLYRLIGDASFDEVVEQFQAVIERNRIQDVTIEVDNLAPLFYVPEQILLTGPEGELEQIVREYGLELIGEKITIPTISHGERTKSQRGALTAQNLQFAAYQIADGTVQEVVTSINELESNVSSSPNLLTSHGAKFYVNCGGTDDEHDPYIFRNGNDPLTDWNSVYPAIPSTVQEDYGITGKGVQIAILDSVHTNLTNTLPYADVEIKSLNGVDINVWSGASWSPLPVQEGNDSSSHGVFVAGLAHAMAPEADIHLLPVLNQDGVGDLSTLIHAIYAFTTEQLTKNVLTNGAVINLSLTIDASEYSEFQAKPIFDSEVELLKASLENADQAGIVVVAAAGNDFKDNDPYLADLHPNIISVGANYRNERSCFSRLGIVYAPGGGAGTTDAGHPSTIDCSNNEQVNYQVNNCSLNGQNQQNCVRSWVWDGSEWVIGAGAGTSFSAPQVTGLVALYLHQKSGATPTPPQVRKAIWDGAITSSYITQCGMNPSTCGIMNVESTLGIPIPAPILTPVSH